MLRKIDNEYGDPLIRFEKIKNFTNVCKVTGMEEDCNIELEYIPHEYLIELDSYREMMSVKRNQYIEEICKDVFDTVIKEINPLYLQVKIFLLDEKLTPWTVTLKKGEKK